MHNYFLGAIFAAFVVSILLDMALRNKQTKTLRRHTELLKLQAKLLDTHHELIAMLNQRVGWGDQAVKPLHEQDGELKSEKPVEPG